MADFTFPTGFIGAAPTASRTGSLLFSDGTNTGSVSVSSVLSLIQAGDTSAFLTPSTAASTYAPLASPALTGIPTTTTATLTDNSTKIASTAFVKGQNYLTANQTITVSGDATATGTNTLAIALATVNSNVGTFQGITVNGKGLVTGAVNQNYAPIASPTFTGTVTIPAGAAISGYVSTATLNSALPSATTSQLYGGSGSAGGTTVITLGTGLTMTGSTLSSSGGGINSVAGQTGTAGAISLANLVTGGVAPLASPALTGTPTSTTASVDTNTTQIATTAFVLGQSYLKASTAGTTYAPLASPALTGTPTTTTAANGTNTTQIASTAFVQNAITASGTFNAAAVAITGGTIDGTTLGATTPSSGAFTSLSASGTVTISAQTASTIMVLNASKQVISGTIGAGLSLTGNTLAVTTLGTVTSVTSATGAITVANTTSTPALTFVPSSVIVTPVSKSGVYTLAQTDNNATIYTSDTTTVAYTIPQLTAGTQIEVIQGNTAKITWTAGSGVTIHTPVTSATGTRAQWSAMRFKWLTATSVTVNGDIS